MGSYLLVSKADGMKQLKALADSATTIPITRLWLAFVSPAMVYETGSKTLIGAGLGLATTAADAGYSDVADAVGKLQQAGVEVFMSMGGWNYNCFPYFYTKYSVGGYGTSTPNYWKIEKYGQGSIDNCNEKNQFCYTCEPPSEKTDLDLSFSVFPEPDSDGWKAAQKYIEGKAGNPAPQWHSDWIPGKMVSDKKEGKQVKVPGSGAYADKGRDPYEDLVLLAKDLNCSGVDIDYEEMWHADYWKDGPATGGPWTLHQTVYKYSAILKDTMDAINKHAPNMKMSTAAGAVSAWSGKWWGGNLKGLVLEANQKFPELISFMSEGANAGGVNVMTYDLSSNEQFHECPSPGVCSLDQQVEFYMNTYQQAGITASVGYEIGQPAYPDHDHDGSHQLPLTKDKLSTLVSNTQSKHGGGFFWELFKAPTSDDQASPTDTAQAICKQVLPDSTRCDGSIPQMPSDVTV